MATAIICLALIMAGVLAIRSSRKLRRFGRGRREKDKGR